MTIAGQVKQTLASLKGVHVMLENYALIEENQQAKEVLTRNTQRLQIVIRDLERRTGLIEFEEPQYKGF